ncbi:MlaD family protein [Pseudomonas sp. NW5]|uniref:MlaD family protein n=1 Tax=Pseudomonas sp. NW5 TaxID=2934934 RepID=UPI0020218743|nr:MlaD family protein [Pseudomonas sp. NW5]MCL7461112.1 MlaD family protein [Pseudomonas sp. NW5]
MNETRKPFWIGAFLLSGIALLAAGLLLLARDSWFSQPSDYAVYFTGSLDGLDVGADVTYRGVKVGTVREIRLAYDQQLQEVMIPVVLRIQPNLAGSRNAIGPVLEPLIERGLRAQLQTQSLLTGKSIVALDLFPGQPGYLGDPQALDLPVIPSVPSRVDQAADVLRELLASLREMPLRELVQSAHHSLQALERFSTSPALGQGLGNLGRSLAHLEQLSGTLQTQLPAILSEARDSSASLRLALDDARQAMHSARLALEQMDILAHDLRRGLGPESENQYQLLSTLEALTRSSKALQRTVESLEQHPESLIFGKQR